jgi:hypothetical protein
MLDLGRMLRKRTEIKEILPNELVKEFSSRLVQRVKFHVARFRELGFITQDKLHKLRKDETFGEFWQNRKNYWRPKDGVATERPADSDAPLASLESVQSALALVKAEPETPIAVSTQAPLVDTLHGTSAMTTSNTRPIALLEDPTSAPPKASSTAKTLNNVSLRTV